MLRFLLLIFVSLTAAQAQGPKNVILMIGDGMGYNQVQAASLYQYGAYSAQPYWAYYRGPVSTWSLNNPEQYDPTRAWGDFKYFLRIPTDSAAGATALTTGEKVHNGLIQMTQEGQRLEGLVDVAERLGKATGILSTVYLSHATPASFAAHAASRKSVEEISQEMVEESAVDLIMSPGHPWYDDDGKQVGGFDPEPMKSEKGYGYIGGETVWQRLREGVAGADANGDGTADPWTLVDSTEAIKALAQGDTPARVFALLPVYSATRANRGGDVAAAPYAVPVNDSIPSMAEMMRSALNVLSKDAEGFFIMAEGGAIDWAAHANQIGRLIEEQADFDTAIQATMQWVEENSSWEETLLVVTADHETGYLWGPGANPEWPALENLGKGQVPGYAWNSTGHTNQLVPLFARGAGAEALVETIRGNDPRRGPYIDNTDIPKTIKKIWR